MPKHTKAERAKGKKRKTKSAKKKDTRDQDRAQRLARASAKNKSKHKVGAIGKVLEVTGLGRFSQTESERSRGFLRTTTRPKKRKPLMRPRKS